MQPFAIPATGATTAELSFMTIGASNVHAFIGMNGPYWTDTGRRHRHDRRRTRSTDDAIGLVIDDFDFGLAIMRPTSPLDFAKYFALKATANGIKLVGVEGRHRQRRQPAGRGQPVEPEHLRRAAVPGGRLRRARTPSTSSRRCSTCSTRQPINIISTAEMNAALAAGYTGATIRYGRGAGPAARRRRRAAGRPDRQGSARPARRNFDDAAAANLDAIKAADADQDGKFDPIGYEVNTGGTPVYLSMNSPLIRAQGFLELNLFDTIFLTGSVAFELGPTQTVTLSDDARRRRKEVTTMTIGAADVTAFIGASGPYWTDLDGDHEVSWAFNTGTGDDASRTITDGLDHDRFDDI